MGEGNRKILLRNPVIREGNEVGLLFGAKMKDVMGRDRQTKRVYFCLGAPSNFHKTYLFFLQIRFCGICLNPYNKCQFT